MVDHNPEHWFTRGRYPECTCGFAPKDNALLIAHWAAHGFKIHDDHGTLVKTPIQQEVER